MSDDRHGQLVDRLREMAASTSEAAGVELVDLTLRGPSRRRLLRIDIDRAGVEGVNVSDCQKVSRMLEQTLDETEVLSGGYVLEVSSPGIDRPIVTDDDLRRNTGRALVVTTTQPLDGERVFRGVLQGAGPEGLDLLAEDGQVIRIPRDRIEKAQQDTRM